MYKVIVWWTQGLPSCVEYDDVSESSIIGVNNNILRITRKGERVYIPIAKIEWWLEQDKEG